MKETIVWETGTFQRASRMVQRPSIFDEVDLWKTEQEDSQRQKNHPALLMAFFSCSKIILFRFLLLLVSIII